MKKILIILILSLCLFISGCSIIDDNPLDKLPNELELYVNKPYTFNLNETILIESDNDIFEIDSENKKIMPIKAGKFIIKVILKNNQDIYKEISINSISVKKDYFPNIEENIIVNLGEKLYFDTEYEINIKTDSNYVTKIIDEKGIMGVGEGLSKVEISLTSNPEISMDINVNVIDEYVDPFPEIPYMIDVPINTEYQITANEEIKLKEYKRSSINWSIEINESTVFALVPCVVWFKISSLEDYNKSKTICINFIDNTFQNQYSDTFFETYCSETLYHKNLSSNPYFKFINYRKYDVSDFSKPLECCSHSFIKDKSLIYEFFNIDEGDKVLKLKEVPRRLIDISLDDYYILTIYRVGHDFELYLKYYDIQINHELKTITLYSIASVYAYVDDLYIYQSLDFILINKKDIPDELDLDEVNSYKIYIYRYFPIY